MGDVTVRSDSVDVEQIMKQIRSRIREKRGSDYTEAELQRLASAKFEQFADPSGLRSDLLEQFRKRGDEPSTYHRHRGVRRVLLMMAHPLLKRVQKQLMSDLNLYFEIIHNLVIEVTRLGIENHNLKMKVESLSSRLDFDERRSRALEGVVQYRQPKPQHQHQQQQASRPSAPASPAVSAPVSQPAASAAPQGVSAQSPQVPATSPAGQPNQDGQQRGDGSGRRRRRRRRRRPGSSLADSPNAQPGGGVAAGAAGGSAAGAVFDTGADDDGGDDGNDGDEGAADQ